MKKNSILLLGIGQAGNKLVSEMLKRDSRYVGMFVNSAYEDMSNLHGFDPNNAFIFPGQNGSGKNREIAKSFVRAHIKSLVSAVLKYPLQQHIIVFTSSDGGTGSGSTPMFLQLLRQAGKDKVINLVVAVPNYKNDDKISFENNMTFWEEIESLPQGTVNDIKIIDNSKGLTYTEINEKAIDALDKSYTMMGKHEIGNIDEGDSTVYNTAEGYSIPLLLDNQYKNAKEAIDNAIRNSVFAVPNTYNCDYLAVSVIEQDFKFQDVRDCFENVYKTVYKTYNKKFNMVLLTGMDAPDEVIETIALKLEELEEKESQRVFKKKILSTNRKNRKTETTTINQTPAIATEEELDDIASALENMFK